MAKKKPVKVAKVAGVFPTKADVKWVCTSMAGRHSNGYKGWWKQNRSLDWLGLEDFVLIVIAVWEAGRMKADNLHFKDADPVLEKLRKRSQKDTQRLLKELDKFEKRSRKSKIVVGRK